MHPDVRRTLMGIRAFNEAARALVMLGRRCTPIDAATAAEDEDDRQRIGLTFSA